MNERKPTDILGLTGEAKDPLAGIFHPKIAEQATEKNAVVPAKPTPLQPIPTSAFGKEGERLIEQALEQLPVDELDLTTVIRLGSEVQRELGGHIDSLLSQVTRKKAPALFELFKKLAEGITDANLGELEQQVKEGNEPGFLRRTFESWGWASPAARIQKASDGIRESLTSKSETLLQLVNGMEKNALDEVQSLIGSVTQIDDLGRAYLGSVRNFAVATEIGRRLLERAQMHLDGLVEKARESQDPQDVAEARSYELLVEQLRNRVLVLRTAYEKVPAELEVLNTAKGAASSTLAETANGIQEELNDIKSALLKWHVFLQLNDMQQVNDHRREVRTMLSQHGVTILDKVVTQAAEVQGRNRLEDAQLLLYIGNALSGIRTKVEGIEATRKTQFAQAEGALSDARKIFSALPAPTAQAAITAETAKS